MLLCLAYRVTSAHMQTLDAIKTRRAVRGWNGQPVSDADLNQILDCGRFSPSPLNSQPWHFTVVRNKKTIEELTAHAHHGTFLSQADVVVVVTVTQQAKVDEWLAEHEQHVYSGVCAIQNMWLATWDMGLGACWVTLNEKTTRELLDIPADQKLLGSLAIGHPTEPAKAHKPEDRRPLESFISHEKFEKKD